MSKHTTLKLQLSDGRILSLLTTWDEQEQVYRIICKEIPHMVAKSPTLSDAKTHVLRAIWSGGGHC
ncbi:hypothetical protein XPphiXo411_gp56 [Xanthomonas phage Xop411]|uniref:Uncharacterized protein n=1 Tax=Xanthomonas phage Xop411 TaxID=2913975 RepID=A8B111_9CAUD|nr:hypothetical protein XPphiXo411_gp56 [Xanthomonas phage Xop411]ABV26563.1 hypothetical protein [Xanthomonas phage Xop411]